MSADPAAASDEFRQRVPALAAALAYPLHERLGPFREHLERFELELASATLPRRKRLWRFKGTTSRHGKAPASDATD